MKLPSGRPPVWFRITTWLRGKIDAPHVPYGLCGHRDSFEDRADHQANELAGRAAKRFRKIEPQRKKSEAALGAVVGEITKIQSEAGGEPMMRPRMSVWIYRVIAVLAALAEFQISAFTFQHVADFGSRGVALVLAAAFTIFAVFAADQAGLAVRSAIHSQEAANRLIICGVLLLGLPLIAAVAFARFEGVSTAELLKQAIANPLSADLENLHPSGNAKWAMLAALLTMSLALIGLAGIGRFASEYGGRRCGLANLERRRSRLERRHIKLTNRIELLRAKCEVILRKIETCRDHLERIYRSSYQNRVARAARAGRASGKAWTRERVLGTAARELEDRRRDRRQRRHDFVWKQLGGISEMTDSAAGRVPGENGGRESAAPAMSEFDVGPTGASTTAVRVAKTMGTYVNGEAGDRR